ncbi:unnamed protein product [Amaranthus hypochondriacus]
MNSSSKRTINEDANCSVNKKKKFLHSWKQKNSSICIDLVKLGHKFDDKNNEDDESCNSISSVVEPNQAYTIGRSNHLADLIFKDSRVSKQHCQILYDAFFKKLYLLNGVLSISGFNSTCSKDCIVNQFRGRLIVDDTHEIKNVSCCDCTYDYTASMNGVYVNGVKLSEGLVVELRVGDVVMLVCANGFGVCGLNSWIGFMVRKVVSFEEVVLAGFDDFQIERPRSFRPLLPGKVNKRVLALRVSDSESDGVVDRAKSLLAYCNQILSSDDPVSCIRRCIYSCSSVGGAYDYMVRGRNLPAIEPSSDSNVKKQSFETAHAIIPKECTSADLTGIVENVASSEPVCVNGKNHCPRKAICHNGCQDKLPPPGKSFYLNGLKSLHMGSSAQDKGVSLPEILHPVNNILRMFIATFTSDIEWFLSYCDIPSHLPITVACHNTERCWSGDRSKRSCTPILNFPNLVVLYPPFPDSIAFGKDRKNRGVGCHHPKLLVLQREDSIRVIITSANLVAKQWHNVTNTIWWQDFPRRKLPDCRTLFPLFNGNANKVLISDFAAQLAGFMAILVSDVPSEAYWIAELSKYNFSGADGYLVASVPGIHSYRSTSATPPAYKFKCSEMLLGSVEACVVGLSHLFRTAADSNGVRLKKLAAYLGKFSGNICGMTKIILRREKNILSDPNAVSVVVPNPANPKGDHVQLGFLPRVIAQWVSPLWDMGFFRFSGHLCPREALSAAFGENNKKVQLILHISQGPSILDIPKMMEPEHVAAFCSLVASVQRCTGLWRMEEVLHQYKWPEQLESDFVYGSSSIGTSVNAQFLAAFSAAAGKRSQHVFDSEESDPEWGCWTATHELKHPSMRIVFPTIDRVKSSLCGILPSKRLLCFSEKTWQKLKMVNILHDAVPHPCEREGYPMHVKVARRRFASKTNGSSFGWIYCGSHNLSAAAWGRPISSQSDRLVNGANEPQSSSLRLHVCNYELGIIFVFPPPEIRDSNLDNSPSLDDINLPFVVPAPRYGPTDRPATMRAMSDALAEVAKNGKLLDLAAVEEIVEEVPDEDDEVEVLNCVACEEEEEKAYADVLWHQVDSSQSC